MKQKIHRASTVQGSIYGLCRISKRVSAGKVEECAAVENQLLQNGLKGCPEGLCQDRMGSYCDGRDAAIEDNVSQLKWIEMPLHSLIFNAYKHGCGSVKAHQHTASTVVAVISMQGGTMKSRLRPSCAPWPPLKVSR